ncbi:M4 family metallopeptidase [Aeromicrobium sp. IC_218]|uniref:M4 family metallopeptidase n=1 Tax=Aeromicrobium sp. IC_218 TaxID=2545468 RepID=UPI00103DDBC9|nr:M4 family metallopeptidase [Aeromicrobium sp. IC_218]TCI97367.1 M4 family peptidase [Aeromicrobium sp. IC_218]
MTHAIVPPYLLARLAADEPGRFPVAAEAARLALLDRPARPRSTVLPPRRSSPGAGLRRTVSDAGHGTDLPGRRVRAEGEPPTGDVAADEAYDGLGATYRLLADAFGRDSLDDAGLPLAASVHYGRDYDNAYWDGERMVFGDGDGEVFGRFTASVSVIGHELAHGLVQHTAGLVYEGEPGALNESVADVVGVLVEQHAAGQRADEASWLVGAGLFTDAVQGVALRSMAAPGTAYGDDVLGRDPQPAHMRDYVRTRDDHGGVHLNSGIPNKAFHLAATALGGYAWQTAGPLWYAALLDPALPSTATFARLAGATVRAARAVGGREQEAVEAAWQGLGVVPEEES